MKYKVDILQIGSEAKVMVADQTLILFNESAPEELKSYCVITDKNETEGEVKVGDTFIIDNKTYTITTVGDVANENLYTLGHVTLSFDGAKEAKLPGHIHLTPNFEGDLCDKRKIMIE